jgi:hypothetical protein
MCGCENAAPGSASLVGKKIQETRLVVGAIPRSRGAGGAIAALRTLWPAERWRLTLPRPECSCPKVSAESAVSRYSRSGREGC